MESIYSGEESYGDDNLDHNVVNGIEDHITFEVNSQIMDTVNDFHSVDDYSNNAEPFVGMEFESEDAAKMFYLSYASRVGFSVRISKSRRSRNDESIIMRRFVCSKEGFHSKKGGPDDGRKRRKRATIREGCNAMIEVIQKYYGRWVVSKLVKEHNHVVAAPSRVRYVAPEEYAQLEPFLGMEFPSHEDAQTFYYAYASRVGFDVRIRLSRRSTKDRSFVMRRFVCTKEGFTVIPSDEKGDQTRRKRGRAPVREGCKAMFEVLKKDCDKWVVSKLVLEHTHDLAVVPSRVHYIQSQSEVVVLAKNGAVGREKSPILNLQAGDLIEPFHDESKADQGKPQSGAFRQDDTQKLLGYFKRMNAESADFSCAVQVDKDDCLTHVFWADARWRTSYYHFGDAVTVETAFKHNSDMLPFVVFTGVNHHLQSAVFGCGLLADDTEASYVWLFENWMAAMGANQLTLLTTAYDDSISAAVSKVFPQTRHRYHKLEILRLCEGKLAGLCLSCPDFMEELISCVNFSESIQSFELTWMSIIEKYDAGDDEWLESIYGIRHKWVPAYFKDVFAAEISAARSPESLMRFSASYFNVGTELPVFVTLFEHAMSVWYDREILEDLASSFTRPILRTPANMLKQVSEIYTRSVFDIVQEEFVQSLGHYIDKRDDGLIGKYNVVKEGDPQSVFVVTYDFSDSRVKCGCGKFETSGILCRHVFRVFLALDIRLIPERYILKRWTREAKNGFALDECLRYSELYRDAVRYATEGASSGEVFGYAQQALHSAFGDVIHVKQCSMPG